MFSFHTLKIFIYLLHFQATCHFYLLTYILTFSNHNNYNCNTNSNSIKHSLFYFDYNTGIDPEGNRLKYSISGPVFSVDRDTGVVRLRQELDRETQDTIEVIISITDEGIYGTEPNTVSLRRVIPVRDYNDNQPTFLGRPYLVSVSESVPVGSVLEVKPPIVVVDQDADINAEVDIKCVEVSLGVKAVPL